MYWFGTEGHVSLDESLFSIRDNPFTVNKYLFYISLRPSFMQTANSAHTDSRGLDWPMGGRKGYPGQSVYSNRIITTVTVTRQLERGTAHTNPNLDRHWQP